MDQDPYFPVSKVGIGWQRGTFNAILDCPEHLAIRNIFQGFFAGKVSCRWVGLQTELARSITPYSMAMHTLQRLRLFQI